MSRCQALDGHGKQCRRQSIGAYSYHGDGEIYNRPYYEESCNWVLVNFCRIHSDKDETHSEAMKRMRREKKEAEIKNGQQKEKSSRT